MEAITNLLQSLVPEGFDAAVFLKSALFVCLGILAFGILVRLLFGKKSLVNSAVSSAIGILFIYAITIVIYSTGVNLMFLLSPLPFITLTGDYLNIFVFAGQTFAEICSHLVSMIILSFLANLANNWLPTGKNIFSWFFFRCISVLLAMSLHLIVTAIMQALLPEGVITNAPTVLLVLLIIMMAVGALKLLVGAALTVISPIIAFLYTFFFANFIGKELSKAVLTTAILAGIVYLLNYLGATVLSIGAAVLVAYIPFLVALLVIWYIIGHKF